MRELAQKAQALLHKNNTEGEAFLTDSERNFLWNMRSKVEAEASQPSPKHWGNNCHIITEKGVLDQVDTDVGIAYSDLSRVQSLHPYRLQCGTGFEQYNYPDEN